jgi:hypothetical protein
MGKQHLEGHVQIDNDGGAQTPRNLRRRTTLDKGRKTTQLLKLPLTLKRNKLTLTNHNVPHNIFLIQLQNPKH